MSIFPMKPGMCETYRGSYQAIFLISPQTFSLVVVLDPSALAGGAYLSVHIETVERNQDMWNGVEAVVDWNRDRIE